jgi:hypothetical protein
MGSKMLMLLYHVLLKTNWMEMMLKALIRKMDVICALAKVLICLVLLKLVEAFQDSTKYYLLQVRHLTQVVLLVSGLRNELKIQ